MTEMIWLICLEDASIFSIAEMAFLTTLPEFSAPDLVAPTMLLASSARCEELFTVEVISSSAAAVSSSEAACCSVRLDRSSDDEPISDEARRTDSVVVEMSTMVALSEVMDALNSVLSFS